MRLIEWLFERTPRLDDDPPRHARIEPTLTAADAEPAPALAPGDAVELDPLHAMIEYEAADGDVTRRRVTFNRLRPNRDGDWIAEAWCHERRAPRRFRLDGITAFFSDDGEVVEPEAWWRAAGVVLPEVGPPRFDARALRDALRPGLSLLVSLARADGRLCEAEIGAIQAWAEAEAFARDLPMTCEISDRLGELVPAMRPTAEALPGHFARIVQGGDAAIRRLHRAVREVSRADGRIPDSEVAFAAMLEDWAGATAGP
jgi:hypothetical protein